MARCFLPASSMLLVAATALYSPIVAAAELTYSWSGTLQLQSSSSADPWGIGKDGATFAMSTTVGEAAIDVNAATPFANFAAKASRLWIKGQEISFVGSPFLVFTDAPETPLPAIDTVTMAADFSKNGQTVHFSTVVAISPRTYTFSSPVEASPSFPSMPSISQGVGYGVPRLYVAIVPAGTLVTVVPEPATFGLALIGFVALGLRRK